MLRFRITLEDPARLAELADALARTECAVEELGPAELAVDVPRAPSAEQAERELRIYLALWRAQHPAARAELRRPEAD
jgi:hypothetical protein